MSKCREEFEKLYSTPLEKTAQSHYCDLEVSRAWRYWQAAWNARGKVDTNVCIALRDKAAKNAAMEYAQAYKYAAEYVEQENEK